MGQIHSQEKGFLFAGFIYCQDFSLDGLIKFLAGHFGNPLYISREWDFSSFTDYYKAEMGENLKRRFVVFDQLIFPLELSEIKVFTNGLEQAYSQAGRRKVNIDPGFLSHNKLILATTKNHYHRIYLDKGIYLEVTMSFVHGDWRCFDWTYPDYRDHYRSWFKQIRPGVKERILQSE